MVHKAEDWKIPADNYKNLVPLSSIIYLGIFAEAI